MSYGHYPPQQQYGQPPAQHYGGGGGYAMPPAQPHDPYRQWYAARLAELTFNSRPIIQSLSLEAMRQRDEGNWAAMQAITEEIEQAVLRAPPGGKLPLLYLIDSISKNVGSPYTDQLLPVFIGKLFLKTYREVDGVTKSKMEEMLKLWRTGGAYGAELYPTQVREEVERGILGSQPMTQQSVQATLREYLREKEADMAKEFTTAKAKSVNVLVQIDQLLSSSHVPPKELMDISEKIRAMKAGVEPKSAQLTRLLPSGAPAPSPPSSMSPPAPRSPFPHGAPRSAVPQPPPRYPPPQTQYPPYQQGYGSPPVHAAPLPSITVPPPNPVAPVANLPLNVADILRNLNSSGVLSQTHTPEPSKSKSGLESYEDMILALDVRVDVFDMSRLSLPVDHLPVRCKQCGMRFPEGENKLQTHMDWHFRRNRKERETEGRGAHRRWLPSAEEWINENVEGGGPSNASPKKADVTLPTKLPAEKIAALKRKWVPARLDPIQAKVPCPVCKEEFKAEWNEDEEEWVIMNAVQVGSQVYHAVCRAETTLAARLLAKERAESKSPAPSLPPDDTGVKRKASEEPEGQGDEAKRIKSEPIEADEKAVGVEGGGAVDEGVESEVVEEAAEVGPAETVAE